MTLPAEDDPDFQWVKWAMRQRKPAKMHVTEFLDKRMTKIMIKPQYLKRETEQPTVPSKTVPGINV